MIIFKNPGIRFKIEKFPKPEPNPKFISLKAFIFACYAIMTVTIIQMWAITTVIWLGKEVNCVAVSDHTDLVPFCTWTRFQVCWAAPQRPLETSRRAEPDAQAHPALSLVWRCYSWSSSPDPQSPHCTLQTSLYQKLGGFMRTTIVYCCL